MAATANPLSGAGRSVSAGERPRASGTFAALTLLAFMAALMFTSAWNDVITFDEEPHIAAGYTYLTKADYRFNPEHPPLMKDLAAAPLLLLKLRPPFDDKSWTEDPYGQWEFGAKLLFNSGAQGPAQGADADAITRAAKTPMILFTIAFGWFLFWWTRRRWGAHTALLALFFYVLSPTFLAHGRLVTTDVGAAAGYFVALAAFLDWIESPRPRALVAAGCALGFALLTKFSTVGLLPALTVLAVIWALAAREGGLASALRDRLAGTAVIFLIGAAVVWGVYLLHTWNYPPARQRADAVFLQNSYQMGGTLKDIALAVSDKPLARPLAHYTMGLLAALRRSKIGNSPYFLGTIYPAGQPLYFPFVYLVKEPLALHLLTLLAVLYGVSRLAAALAMPRVWIVRNFTVLSFLLTIAIYWAASIASHLNIGVRHLTPVLPFTFVLVAAGVRAVSMRLAALPRSAPIGVFRMMVGLLLLWQAGSVLRVHPSYLSYFNEAAGGPENGWRYVSDSNVDWGQDLKRLAEYARAHRMGEVALDYFGSADPSYYFARAGIQYIPVNRCSPPQSEWMAVSAMWYVDSARTPECDYRRRLPMDRLAARVGYSIFLFHLDSPAAISTSAMQ